MVWKPHVTVAAVIEQDQRFLVVEEKTRQGRRFNQPAGHLEEGESLVAAIKREVFEETAWRFEPESLVAVQLWRRNPESATFVRFCFSGRCSDHDPGRELDHGILATHWLSRDELAAKPHRLRSPLVLICIDDYVAGRRHPLSVLHSYLDLDHE
ncbi:MAG: NUDIX hydrolase [Gammaproteobacteria bacterium]